MAQSIWGLQALIASKTRPVNKNTFFRVIGDQYKEMTLNGPILKIADIDEVDMLTSLVIACYRFANHLGISLDDEIRKRLNQ